MEEDSKAAFDIGKHSSPDDTATGYQLAAEAAAANNAKAKAAAFLKPQTHPDFDGEHCLECGDDMPPLRLTMGRIRCTACEAIRERRTNP